jgi:hypothetical protein
VRTQVSPTGIRITLAGLAELLHDIVAEAVRREPDMHIVGEYPGEKPFAPELAVRDVDVVILGVEPVAAPEELPLVAACLHASPFVRLLLLAPSGRSGLLYELRPQQLPLGEVSREKLLAAIRGQPWDTVAPPQGH